MKHNSLVFLADSNPANGASNINPTGSSFTVQLETPLIIPKDAQNPHIIVRNANVWFTTPNIVTGINSRLGVQYQAGPIFFIDIPTGLYDVDTLSVKIQDLLQIESNYTLPDPLFHLEGDDAENKIIIQFNEYDVKIFLNQINGIQTFLGFNSQIIQGPVFLAGDNLFRRILGESPAQFNNIEYYLIKCSSLLSRGIELNSTYSGIMARVDIRAKINTKIIYDPNQEIKITEPELPGLDLSTLTFDLTDQNSQLVDTRGLYWNIMFEIHWDSY